MSDGIRTSPYIASLLSNSSKRRLSTFWDTCPITALKDGLKDGHFMREDFIGNFAQATNLAVNATLAMKESGWTAFTGNDAGNTITMNTDEPYGSVAMLLTGDNLSTAMVYGGRGAAGAYVFESGKPLWAEVCCKFSSVTDDRGGFFIGFGEEALCVTVGLVGSSDALTDKDLIGFHRDAADGDQIDLKYNTASGGGITALKADALPTALVADTYTKLGMYFDGTTLQFYQDGAAISSGSVAYTATNFPDGEECCFYMGGTNKGTTANTLEVDWVALGQQRA